MNKWTVIGVAGLVTGIELMHQTVWFNEYSASALEQPGLLHNLHDAPRPRPLRIDMPVAVASASYYMAVSPNLRLY